MVESHRNCYRGWARELFARDISKSQRFALFRCSYFVYFATYTLPEVPSWTVKSAIAFIREHGAAFPDEKITDLLAVIGTVYVVVFHCIVIRFYCNKISLP